MVEYSWHRKNKVEKPQHTPVATIYRRNISPCDCWAVDDDYDDDDDDVDDNDDAIEDVVVSQAYNDVRNDAHNDGYKKNGR